MRRVLLILVIVILAIAGVIYFTRNASFQFFGPSASATVNGQKFQVLVADDPDERQIGLSEKKSLPQNQGMIFLMDKADYYSFWMKNMDFPIDIIFISGDRIVTIYSDQQPAKDNENPPTITSKEPADKVLEINAGLAKKHNLKEGDSIKLEGLPKK